MAALRLASETKEAMAEFGGIGVGPGGGGMPGGGAPYASQAGSRMPYNSMPSGILSFAKTSILPKTFRNKFSKLSLSFFLGKLFRFFLNRFIRILLVKSYFSCARRSSATRRHYEGARVTRQDAAAAGRRCWPNAIAAERDVLRWWSDRSRSTVCSWPDTRWRAEFAWTDAKSATVRDTRIPARWTSSGNGTAELACASQRGDVHGVRFAWYVLSFLPLC